MKVWILLLQGQGGTVSPSICVEPKQVATRHGQRHSQRMFAKNSNHYRDLGTLRSAEALTIPPSEK